ncbi:MAG: hypothetical protein ACRCRW_03815, partial [Aeromonadaceae bacterium]
LSYLKPASAGFLLDSAGAKTASQFVALTSLSAADDPIPGSSIMRALDSKTDGDRRARHGQLPRGQGIAGYP